MQNAAPDGHKRRSTGSPRQPALEMDQTPGGYRELRAKFKDESIDQAMMMVIELLSDQRAGAHVVEGAFVAVHSLAGSGAIGARRGSSEFVFEQPEAEMALIGNSFEIGSDAAGP